MAAAFGQAMAQEATAPTLTADEKAQAKKIYFERCAGCHGVLRKGATGKNLEPHWTKKDKDGKETSGGTLKLGSARLEKIIGYGTDGGMVNFDDILTKEEITPDGEVHPDHTGCSARVQLQGHHGFLEAHRAGQGSSDQADEQVQPEEHVLGNAA